MVFLFGYIFSYLELITYGIVFGIACLNLAVIWPTKLLHDNFKCILITQSIVVIFFLLIRSVILVQKMICNDPFVAPYTVLRLTVSFVTFFRRLLGHVLIIERFIATMRSNSYEKVPKVVFALTWLSITVTFSIVNIITRQASEKVTKFNLITASASTILSLIEYLTILIIGYYNRRKYANQIEGASPNNYHIEKRYQVSDNMKTAKQLSPAFLCFFLSNLLMMILEIILASGVKIEQYQLALAFSFLSLTNGIFCAIIELTVVTHHPLLKRRFVILLKRLFCLKRNHIGEEQPNAAALATVAQNGAIKTEDHFHMLKQLWSK